MAIISEMTEPQCIALTAEYKHVTTKPKPKQSKHGIGRWVQTDVVIHATVTKPDGIAYYGASFVRVTIGVKIGVGMSDLISRKDAINAMMILKRADDLAYGCEIPESFDSERAIEALKNLPSAEPERKKGKWIDGKPYVNSHWCVCSICHETSPDGSGNYNFCPHCGADMSR